MFQRIGTKLHAALGLAVLLTLLSSGVGVYYFELSGDLSHRLARESFPGFEGAWRASEVAFRLSAYGERELARVAEGGGADSVDPGVARVGADSLVEEMRAALARPGGLPGSSGAAVGLVGG